MSALIFRVELPGRPIVKKNTQRVYGSGRGRRVVYSAKFVAWHKNAMAICQRSFKRQRIEHPVHAKYTFQFLNRQAEADVSNLCEAPGDLLQKCGVIKDDKQIVRLSAEKTFGSEPKTVIELFILNKLTPHSRDNTNHANHGASA